MTSTPGRNPLKLRLPDVRRRSDELALLIAFATMVLPLAWVTESRVIRRATPADPVHALQAEPGRLLRALSPRIGADRAVEVHAALLKWRAAHPRASALHQLVAAGIVSDSELRAIRPILVIRSPEAARAGWRRSVLLLAAAFLLVHLFFRFTRFEGSDKLLPILLPLTAAAAILLFCLNDPLRERPLHGEFVEGAVIGCAVLAVTARWTLVRELLKLKYLMLLGAVSLAVALLLIGTGPSGTRINLFHVFQPVEFIKLLAVVFAAGYFASKDSELTWLHSFRLLAFSLPRRQDILPVVLAVGAVLGLFFLQHDLGPALVLYLVFLCLFAAASRRVELTLAGLVVLIAAFWFGAYKLHLDTVATRIEMWLSPWECSNPNGIQLAESLWALASGGVTGMGIGNSLSRAIPAGHTDLILAAAGETFGLAGFAAILLLLGVLFLAIARISRSLRDAHSVYLTLGIGLLLGIQTVIIAAATVGLLPLTGIPVPFVSYGKSALIAHFLLIGLVLNLSAAGTGTARTSRVPGLLPVLVAAAFAAVVLKAAWIATVQADGIACRPALTFDRDEKGAPVPRYAYNRRLPATGARIPRGPILDRKGERLAYSDDLGRHYPLGPDAVHILGHVFTQTHWTDPRSIERTFDRRLRGWDYREEVVKINGRASVRRDYSALLPALRNPGVRTALAASDRSVRITLDARLQRAMAEALDETMAGWNKRSFERGAGIALEASSGEILASVSRPSYDPNRLAEEDFEQLFRRPNKAANDRARFELYPPGSGFKTVMAAALLESGQEPPLIVCRHEQPVAWTYAGGRHVKDVADDAAEDAHGKIGIGQALVHSCNIYFATAGAALGAGPLYDMASVRLRLELKGVRSSRDLEPNLPDNGYGQAAVSASPMRMAGVAAAIANGGWFVEPALTAAGPKDPMRRVFAPGNAGRLRAWMIETVERGTGTRARVPGLVVGGKTGTAQNRSEAASHAWFIGFAHRPGKPQEAIAFAFLVENGGYGGGIAAQCAAGFLRRAFAERAN